MGEVAAVIVLMLLALLIGAGVTGAVLWYVLRTKLVTPVPVYEQEKKKLLLTPGDGLFVLKEKRKPKVNDEHKAWFQEQNDRSRSNTDF